MRFPFPCGAGYGPLQTSSMSAFRPGSMRISSKKSTLAITVSISWKPSGRLPAIKRLRLILAGARTNNPLLTVVICSLPTIVTRDSSLVSRDPIEILNLLVDIIAHYAYFEHKICKTRLKDSKWWATEMSKLEPKGKRDKDVILKKVAAVSTIAASVITMITKVLTVGGYVPQVLFKVFLILTLLIILVWIIYVFMTSSFASILSKCRAARKNKVLFKKYFDDFTGFSDRLGELLKDNRCDNIPYVFIHLQNMPPEFNYPRSLIYDLANLLVVFKEGMKKVHRRNFRLLIKWFDLILRVYNSQLVVKSFRRIRNQYRDKMSEHDKEAYETSRENYVRFL